MGLQASSNFGVNFIISVAALDSHILHGRGNLKWQENPKKLNWQLCFQPLSALTYWGWGDFITRAAFCSCNCKRTFLFAPISSYCLTILDFRERSNRAALFDGIEEGGIRASSSYASHEIDEQENEKAMDGLQDRVNLLKRVSPAHVEAFSFIQLKFHFSMFTGQVKKYHNFCCVFELQTPLKG